MTIGWKPRYNPSGTRLTWDRIGYWQAQFYTDSVEIAQNGSVLVIDGQPTDFPGANELSAGGGFWAAFRPDPVRVYTSDGHRIDGAGVPVVNPDRLWGYVDDYNALVKNLIFDGAVVSRGSIADVRASRQALVWSDAGRTWGMRLDRPDAAHEIQAAPSEFRPIPVDTPEGPWVTCHTHTGLVCYPMGQTDGYRFDNGGQAFYHDSKYEAGAIVSIFTNDQGVQSTHAFLLNTPRVPLNVIVDPTPPVIFTPPQPKEEPLMNLPDPGAVKAALKRERDKFPSATVTEAQMGQILNNTALQFPHMGMHRKDGQAPQPGTGIGVSHDVLRVMPPGDPLGYWSDVLGATGVGQAIPLAPTWKRSNDGAESFVVPVAVGTSQPPVPPPPTPPAPQPPAPPAPPVGKPLPDYGQFVTVESTEVANAYEQRTGHGPAISDQYHTAYRRLVERWTHRDILNDILGRALQDGGPGGDLR